MNWARPSVWLSPLLLSVLSISACSTLSSGGASSERVDQQETIAHAAATLVIKTPDVPVSITPSANGQIHVHFHGQSSEEAHLELFTQQRTEQLYIGLRPVGPVKKDKIKHNLQLDVQLPAKTIQDLTIRTASGDISLQDYQGKNLSLNTATGRVEIDNTQARTAIQTVTGPVVLKLDAIEQDLDVQSDSGNLSVYLAETAHFATNLESPSHAPKIAFALQGEQSLDNRLLGTVGNGGPLLNLRTQSGKLNLLKLKK